MYVYVYVYMYTYVHVLYICIYMPGKDEKSLISLLKALVSTHVIYEKRI